MPTGILVPPTADDIPDFARRAESLGYDTLWCGELWGQDVFVALAGAVRTTDTIRLGTAIANVYGRSPATLAQAAASLTDAAGSRVRLGLGTSTPKAVEDLHGVPFDRPARRLHETVELVGEFLGDEGAVEYEGELFDVADFPSLGADVPVYAAALGSAMRRATGRTADGWIPHNIPFPLLEEAFETIANAAHGANRDPEAIRVSPAVPAAVSDDPESARDAIRNHIAYYVGSGDGYRRAVGMGFPDRVDDIAEAWRGGNRDDARDAVTEDMIAALGVAGTPADAREQLDAIAANPVVDEPYVNVPAGTDDAMTERTVDALAPDSR